VTYDLLHETNLQHRSEALNISERTLVSSEGPQQGGSHAEGIIGGAYNPGFMRNPPTASLAFEGHEIGLIFAIEGI